MISDEEAENRIEHTGGGYYELSDGSKTEKAGKQYAIEQEKKLVNNKAPDNVILDDGTEVEVGMWKDYKNYHCPVCPYSDLEFQRFEAHVFDKHTQKERERGERIVSDRFGREQ